MQLGILVNGPLDAQQKPIGFEIRQMVLKIEVRAAAYWRVIGGRACRLIEHLHLLSPDFTTLSRSKQCATGYSI
jgi:hypothetical protein